MKPGEIKIKDSSVLDGLLRKKAHDSLVEIIEWIAETYGITITEFYREKRHNNDLHGTIPVRAADLRFWCYESDKFAYEIMNAINSRWQYDHYRKHKVVAKIHNSGMGIHFHIQVHERTVRI